MDTGTTYHTEYYMGVPIGVPNRLTKQTREYHISYNNHDTDDGMYGCDTTALYINETSQFLILNGKHTDNYSACSTLQDCIDYFYRNLEQANARSEHGKLFKCDGTKAEYVKGGY